MFTRDVDVLRMQLVVLKDHCYDTHKIFVKFYIEVSV